MDGRRRGGRPSSTLGISSLNVTLLAVLFFFYLFIIHEFTLLKQFVRSHPVLPPSKTAVDGSPSGPGGKNECHVMTTHKTPVAT